MKFSVLPSKKFAETQADVLIFFAYHSKNTKLAKLSEDSLVFDRANNTVLTKMIQKQKFSGTIGTCMIVHGLGGSLEPRIGIVAGLGDSEALHVSDVLDAIATAVKTAKSFFAKHVAFSLPDHPAVTVNGLVEATRLSLYEFSQYKQSSHSHEIERVELYIDSNVSDITNAQLYAKAVYAARDLVNEPSSVTTPTFLADFALDIAKKSKKITAEIIDAAQMKKLGMHALLGIAKGSDEPPKFIRLEYNSGGKTSVCLVGKGVTFDSGGLSLKPQSGMETMKLDMAGAAAILGVFSVLEQLNIPIHVTGLICAVENMPSGKSVKPGDVVKAMNGKTIEIANTDAEGRVILADAMSYAGKFLKPDVIIDLATLTGACMVALGEDIAGLFSNDAKLTNQLLAASTASEEKLWSMPLENAYKELIKSQIADIRNISKSKFAGAITGALFIGEFVPDGIPWAHLDIAGPAFAEHDTPLASYGGTGFGVRLLLEYLKHI